MNSRDAELDVEPIVDWLIDRASAIWAQLADRTSIPVALATAVAAGGVALFIAWRRPLFETEEDLSPSMRTCSVA